MADIQVSGNQLNPVADISKEPPSSQRLVVAFQADFTGANTRVIVDLTFQQAGRTFSSPRTLFIDNSDNPSPVKAEVTITGHKFTIPARSNGFYPMSATGGSRLILTSVGGASAPSPANLYNYEIPSQVWYSTGAAGTTIATIADGGDVAEGAKADAAVTDPTLAGSVIALLKGILTRVSAGQVATGVGNASAVMANAAAVSTLAAVAAKTNFMTAVNADFTGATAGSTVVMTITGLIGGTWSIPVVVPAGAAVAGAPVRISIPGGIAASGPNVAIVATLPALGVGNLAGSTSIAGFQQ